MVYIDDVNEVSSYILYIVDVRMLSVYAVDEYNALKVGRCASK